MVPGSQVCHVPGKCPNFCYTRVILGDSICLVLLFLLSPSLWGIFLFWDATEQSKGALLGSLPSLIHATSPGTNI